MLADTCLDLGESDLDIPIHQQMSALRHYELADDAELDREQH